MRFRLAGVIALSITGALATAFAHAPQGRGSVTVPQVTPNPPPGQTGTAGPPLVTTGLIVGRVIDAASGTPVAGVIVTLNGGPARTQGLPLNPAAPGAGGRGPAASVPRILTDGEGRFAFRNLTRGTYTISATKSGYSAGAYGRNRPEGPTRSLQLDDNERVADAAVKIFKFATITGRILDEAGEPIVGARVVAYRRVLLAGRRRFREATSTQTDDRGIYRLASLVPADYAVAAPLSAITAPGGTSGRADQNFSMSAMISVGPAPVIGAGGRQLGSDGRFVLQSDGTALAADASGKWRGYGTQYYPVSRTISSADVLALASGEDRTGIDIQMRYVPVSTISGTLTVPTGSPANLMMRLIAADTADIAVEPESAVTATDANGGFVFACIPSGQYTIQVARVSRDPLQFEVFLPAQAGPGGTVTLISPANPGGRGQQTPPDPMLWASVPVTVGDSDVSGVNVAMQEGFTVSGRFEFTGTHPRPDGTRLMQIPVSVEPADGRDSGLPQVSAPSRAGNDGRWVSAPRLPGKYLVRIGGMPSGFIVQSIVVNGVNVVDAPFDLTGNVTNAVVTFTDQISSVGGTVRGVDPGDDPPLVVVFPADSRAWKDYGLNPLRMKSTRAPAPGSFSFGSLVAGDYFAIAIPDQFSAEYQDPAYLELLSRGAERFTLGPGEKKTVSLDIASAKPPGAGRDVVPAADAADECACVAPQTPPSPTRDQRVPEPTGTGSISGTITIDDGSPRPARLTRVRVANPQGGSITERTALTDDAGHYTIAWLPAGDYVVTASKPAFLNTSYGAKRLMGAGAPVHVGNGQTLNNINITMAKGAVISGVVVDDSGQPAAGVRVQLMAFSRREGERVLGNAASAMGPGSNGPPLTNDRGEYRFYGLRPGKYVVMAQPAGSVAGQELRQLSDSEMRAAIAEAAKAPTPQVVIDTPRTIAPASPTDVPSPPPVGRAISFSPVYYPGTVFDTEAVEVTAVAGEELNGINVQLSLVPASRIEGQVIGPDGQIATGAQVSLLKFTGSGMSSTGLQQRSGMFQSTGVPAGRYVLTAQLNPGGGRGATVGPLAAAVSWAQIDLNLNGDDQRDLVLALAPLPTIAGRVVFDGAPPPDMGAVRVSLEMAGTNGVSAGRQSGPATPDSNGEFTIMNVMPGKYRLNALVLGPRPPEGMQPPGAPIPPPAAIGAAAAAGWSVGSATIAGQDAWVSSFEVRHGQPLTGAEVTMTNKPSEISGKLIDGSNKPVPNMTVVLFPVDRALWVTNAGRVNRISRPNATGTFSFPLAVPGEYYLAVLTELDNADWQEVEFKEQLVASAIKVTIAKGEKKIQDMRVGG